MNLIKKLKRIFEKKETKAKEELRKQMNSPCNCKYCQNQDTQKIGKYSDINKTNN